MNSTTIDTYIAARPRAHRATLEHLRALLRKALPRATEGISYRIPVYTIDGTMVLYFASFTKHYAIYPATDRLLDALGDEVRDRVRGKGSIHFSYDEAVPVRLITRIAKVRAAEAKAAAKAKAAKKKGKPSGKPKRRPASN